MFDKFQILKHPSDDFDEVRRREYKSVGEKDRTFIKGQRYTLVSHQANLDEEGRLWSGSNYLAWLVTTWPSSLRGAWLNQRSGTVHCSGRFCPRSGKSKLLDDPGFGIVASREQSLVFRRSRVF